MVGKTDDGEWMRSDGRNNFLVWHDSRRVNFSRKLQTNRPKDSKHVDTALLTRNKKGRGKNNWREKKRSIGNAIRNNILFGCYMYQKISTRFLTDAQASKSHDRDWNVETTKRTQKILHHMIQQIVMDHIEDESMASFKLRFTKINKQNSVWRHDCRCQSIATTTKEVSQRRSTTRSSMDLGWRSILNQETKFLGW
jgi:hypothetical protein